MGYIKEKKLTDWIRQEQLFTLKTLQDEGKTGDFFIEMLQQFGDKNKK